MSGGRCWLVQWHPGEVNNSIGNRHTVLTPALGQHISEVSPGDRVAMWVTGSKAEAGVWALGVITSDVYDSQHERDYGDVASGESLRPTVDVTLTHLLDQDIVSRPTLKADDRFAGYPLFERGRARGTNPRPLSEEQWSAILERTPHWAALDRPSSAYRVTVDFLTDASDEDAACAVLIETITSRRYDELSFEAERMGQSSAAWEYFDNPAPALTGHSSAGVVSWETEVQSTTAYRAFLQVFHDLRRDAAGRLVAGELSMVTP